MSLGDSRKILFTFLAFGTFLRVSGADKLFLNFCVAAVQVLTAGDLS